MKLTSQTLSLISLVANGLTGERVAKANLFAIDAEPDAASDGDRLLGEGIVEITDGGIVVR